MFKEIGKLFMIKPQSLTSEELSFYRDLSFKNFVFFKEHFNGDFASYKELLKNKLKSLGLLAIDQEGGQVCRIKQDLEAPLEIVKKSQKEGKEVFIAWAEKIAKTLKSYELNLNLAPVVDLGDESASDFLKGRTYGNDPKLVTFFANIFIEIHKKWHINTTLKHFPGLGEVKVDPHLELSLKERVSSEDLYPFKELAPKVSFIMTTHILVPEWDTFPVTFSQRAIKFLREFLNYQGVIVSDDLQMGALARYSLSERIIRTLVSGHNLIIFCGKPLELVETLFELKSELEKSQVIKIRVKESLTILEKYFIL
ncbi:MAG: hypothetical protein N2327_00485 [Caldimicrobium sp.]|nr:hypothetical protein [Caldimicrobium sp.]MCX7872902.1 hypothetical protein [Caldimicrobium sp.]MDW8094494.1 glycoside hydrolase family 3 N-terminal domain-containing protein [Caldimicrobium sp.]